MSDGLGVGVDDPDSEVLIRLAEDDRVVLVAFGGLYMRVGISDFEFHDIASGLDAGLILVRDRSRRIYQGGIVGLGRTFPEMTATIRSLVGDRRLVMIGNSGGGFAALVFGALAGADEVHAFSPVTFLGRWQRRRHHDDRFAEDIDRLNRGRAVQRRYLDARRWVRRPAGPTSFHLYFSERSELDRLHAERLAGLPGVVLHPGPGKGHGVIRDLALSGELQVILRDAVSRSSGPGSPRGSHGGWRGRRR